MTPRQLGEHIGSVYCEGLASLAELLEARLDPAELTTEVEALKAQLIERYVVLGHQRSSLGDAQRQSVDMATGAKVRSVNMAHFKVMSTACETYRLSHNALANLLASFNVLHQYAAFELLALQLPDEAARLGVG